MMDKNKIIINNIVILKEKYPIEKIYQLSVKSSYIAYCAKIDNKNTDNFIDILC